MGVCQTAADQTDFTGNFVGIACEVFELVTEQPRLDRQQRHGEQQYRPAKLAAV